MNKAKNSSLNPAPFIGLLLLLTLTLLQGCKKIDPERITKVETISASSIDYFSSSVEGNILDIEDNGIDQHGFCWSTSTNPVYSVTSLKLGPKDSKGSFTATIDGLDAGFTYYVKAYAITSDGIAYGGELNFTTKYDSPSVSITTSPTNTSHGSSFSASASGQNIITRGVYYSESPMPDNTKLIYTQGEGAGAFVCNIIGLKSETSYYLRPFVTDQHSTVIGAQVVINTTPMVFDIIVTPYEIYNNTPDDGESEPHQHEMCGTINTWKNDNVSNKVVIASWYNSFAAVQYAWTNIVTYSESATLPDLQIWDSIGVDFRFDDWDASSTNDWMDSGSSNILLHTILDLENNDPTVMYNGTYIIPRGEDIMGERSYATLIVKFEFTEK